MCAWFSHYNRTCLGTKCSRGAKMTNTNKKDAARRASSCFQGTRSNLATTNLLQRGTRHTAFSPAEWHNTRYGGCGMLFPGFTAVVSPLASPVSFCQNLQWAIRLQEGTLACLKDRSQQQPELDKPESYISPLQHCCRGTGAVNKNPLIN